MIPPRLILSGLVIATLLGLAWRVHGLGVALDMERSAHATTRAAVALQSAQVRAWKRAADERAEAARLAMDSAKAAQFRAASLARSLYSFKTTGDECHDLQNLIDRRRAADADGMLEHAATPGDGDPGSGALPAPG